MLINSHCLTLMSWHAVSFSFIQTIESICGVKPPNVVQCCEPRNRRSVVNRRCFLDHHMMVIKAFPYYSNAMFVSVAAYRVGMFGALAP